MFKEDKIIKENYYDDYMDELDIFDQDFNKEVTEEEFEFGDTIFNFLQRLIDLELKEEYTTETNLIRHFKKHCIQPGKKSTRNTVYYDFLNVKDYDNYERIISDKAISIIKSSNEMFIKDLYDTSKVINSFRKLFEGDKTLVFSLACGFHNETGPVRICIHAFATDYTKNYLNNTVDLLIQAPDNKTIALYPIDANYLETKINNEITKIPEAVLLKINH